MSSPAQARTDDAPGGLLVVPPGAGTPLTAGGPTTIIARQGWSEGHVLIFDQQLAPGTLMGAHHHTDETQGAYVIAGSIGFWVDGEETTAGPGTYVVRPAGSVHSLWNPGEEMARMLEITTPAARYQEFILGVEALRGRDAGQEELAAHAAAYGTYLDEDVTAGLTDRLGLGGGRFGFARGASEGMRAAVIHGPGDLRIEELPQPQAGPGEVVLRVSGAGVCGSDGWMYRTGGQELPPREQGPPPLVPGHEFAGVVVEAGPDTSLGEGEAVADGAGISCGRCRRCREGRTNLCESYRTLGAYFHGGLAEYVVVPEATCVPVSPHGVKGDDAALAQPMAIAHHGVSRGRVSEDDRVLLMGAGGVGIFAVWAASHRGAHVTVVDTDPARLALAEKLGAAATILNDVDGDLASLLADHGPWTVALETTGARAPLEAAFRALERGSRLVLLGMHHEPRALDLSWATFGELDLLGTQAHVCAVDLPAALDLLGRRAEGWSDVAPVVLTLDELVDEALIPLSEGRSRRIKSLIDPSGSQQRPYNRDS